MTEVVLLTRADCDFCDAAKVVLARLAPEFDLSVRTLDMSSAEGEVLARTSGMMFPPGLFLDGTLVFHGRLSERRLRKELGRRGART